MPEFEKARRPQGRADPARRGPALGPVQRQAQRRHRRDRRHDVPPAAGGQAVRQEQLPRGPDDKVKADKNWDWSDFQAGPVQSTTYKDKVVGVPDHHRAGGPVLPQGPAEEGRHRGPAKTMEELKADAPKIKAANPGVAGFVARTGKSAAVTQFSSFLYSFGGDFTDASGKATRQHHAAKKAYAFYGGLIKDHGPGEHQHRHELARGHGDLHAGQGRLLHRGRLALQERHRPGQVQGRRHGRLRAAARPARPAPSRTTSRPGRWASTTRPRTRTTPGSSSSGPPARNRRSKNQKAGVPGPRTSVWADPAGTSTYPKDLAAAIAVSAKNGVGHDRPQVVKVAEAREIVGQPDRRRHHRR